MAETPGGNEVTVRLPRNHRSVPRARALTHAVLGAWGLAAEVIDSAELVLSELLTNALRVPVPSGRQVGVRIARSPADGLLRLEVSDAGPGRPEIRTPDDEETGGRGLLLVDALAHRWGVEERAYGIGKTVWAELKAPDIITRPTGTETAAATVRPGQHVRLWGEWHEVAAVRSEQRPTDDTPTVLLLLDEGPPLRVRPTEPLTVRNPENA